MARLTESERIAAFGHPGRTPATDVTSRLPWSPHLQNGTHQRVRAHTLIADVFVEACIAASRASNWVPQRIDSLVVRKIRGGASWSNHSWGLAFDFFATPADVPPPGGVWTPDNGVPAAFANEFMRRGFTWGATWNRKDVPHIEWAGPPPGYSTRPVVDILESGDRGKAVTELQEHLKFWGHYSGIVDGIYGPATEAAVRSYQRAKGLDVDGIAGPDTIGALEGDQAAFERYAKALETQAPAAPEPPPIVPVNRPELTPEPTPAPAPDPAPKPEPEPEYLTTARLADAFTQLAESLR